MATRLEAAIKADFDVDASLVKLESHTTTFEVEIDGAPLYSLMREGRFLSHEEILARIHRAHPPRPARPWDLFDKDIGRVSDDIARARLEVCNDCDRYLKLTHQCKECGCIMNAKVKLPNAYCPIQKWSTAAPAPPTEK